MTNVYVILASPDHDPGTKLLEAAYTDINKAVIAVSELNNRDDGWNYCLQGIKVTQ